MPRAARALRAEREVLRLCHSGLDNAGVRREVTRALGALMPIDAVFLATADPETLVFTGAWPDEPLDRVTPLFLANEFGGADVNKFTALATSPRPVASLDQATRGERQASERYRDILRPLGLGDELRAALRTGPDCWGYLCLHRADAERGFSPGEARTLARLAPHLAHALRTAVLLHDVRPARAPGGPGVVLLTAEHSLVAMTSEAEELLSLLEPEGTRPLPTAVYAVASALRAIETGVAPAGRLPTARIRTRTGSWLALHASRLNREAGDVTVVVEPVEPRATVPLVLTASGLSPREAEIARLVLRGSPTRTIADELHISPHTVQDHLKAVFDKLGVRSRRDLVSHLLGTHATGSGTSAAARG